MITKRENLFNTGRPYYYYKTDGTILGYKQDSDGSLHLRRNVYVNSSGTYRFICRLDRTQALRIARKHFSNLEEENLPCILMLAIKFGEWSRSKRV